MPRAVFLDRDGVLNRAVLRQGRPYPPASLNELEILPGVKAACRDLRKAGYVLVMVTNQPDIGTGKTTHEIVDEINDALQRELDLIHVQVCPHDDGDGCTCRKPEPGMLTAAARAWNIDLASSFMVGDRWRDVEAGQRAGVRTVFIDYEYQERQPYNPDHTVQSLAQAADWILSRDIQLDRGGA